MPLRRLGAFLIALTITGLPLIAQATDAPAPTPGMTGEVIDAQAQVNALKDLPTNGWAYQSILDLVNDGIVVGYPDGTFKGNRPMTRYEAAVIVERAVQYLTKQLSNPQTAPQVTPKDIAALRALVTEFRGDIDALKLRVGDIDSRLKSVEAAQKNDEAQANRAKLGAVYYVRAGSVSENTAAFSSTAGGPVALPPGTALTGGSPGSNAGNSGNANKYLAGANSQGYGYQLLRILLDGTLDSSLSYHVRLENRMFWDSPTQQLSTLTTPGGTVAAVPNNAIGATAANSYPANTSVRLNYAYAQYNDPSGLNATIGRLNETDGTLGLLWADQWNGASVGYSKNRLNLRASYGFTWPEYDSNLNSPAVTTLAVPGTSCKSAGATFTVGCSGLATQVLAAQLSYNVNKKLTLGAAYLDDINDQILDWNSTLGVFTAPYTNLAEGSAFMRYADQISKVPFSLEAEGSYRFGNDPNTGSNWRQPYAVWVQGKLGWYNPTPFRPYLEAGYIGAGYNSLSPHSAITNGTSYDYQFQGNANGYQLGYVGLNYWFSKFGRLGVIYQASDIIGGTTIPVVNTAGFARTFLTHDITNGVFLQTWLQF